LLDRTDFDLIVMSHYLHLPQVKISQSCGQAFLKTFCTNMCHTKVKCTLLSHQLL